MRIALATQDDRRRLSIEALYDARELDMMDEDERKSLTLRDTKFSRRRFAAKQCGCDAQKLAPDAETGHRTIVYDPRTFADKVAKMNT